jgi:hypothetical protein
MSRTSRGKPADRSTSFAERACRDEPREGAPLVGETWGNAEPRLPGVVLPRPRAEAVPPGRLSPLGKTPPLPTPSVVPPAVPLPELLAVSWTVADAVAEFVAWAEVAVAVTVK